MGKDVQYIQDYCWNRSYHLQDVPQSVLDPCLQKSLKGGGGGKKKFHYALNDGSLTCSCWKTKADSITSSAERQF